MSEVDESTLVEDGAIPPVDFHDSIERIREVSTYELEVPDNIVERLADATSHLLVSKETLTSAAAALRAGHLVLQGPPGTGKSSLARGICKAFNVSHMSVTAHEDWTVYEVIGRLELRVHDDRREEIEPVNGYFTESVIRCAGSIVRHFDDPAEPQAEWLVVDELNRAYMDKAFGELFTILGTDESISVLLPHQRIGNRELVLPRRFRIIATINSVDRQFVNTLSQGIRRRFTFVTVDIPDKKPVHEDWSLDEKDNSMANKELRTVLKRVAMRVARRLTSSTPKHYDEEYNRIFGELSSNCFDELVELFKFAETLRYADSDAEAPYLPLGTAQLIDTFELFITRFLDENASGSNSLALMDWAVAIKIAPLFDAGSASPDLIETFAKSLEVFSATRRELLRIVAAGMHHVD